LDDAAHMCEMPLLVRQTRSQDGFDYPLFLPSCSDHPLRYIGTTATT
jgi:hypothetical protein